MMDFRQAETAIKIFRKYTCGQLQEYGDPYERTLPIEGDFEFGHEQTWISLPRTTDAPSLTEDEKKELKKAGWFFDDEVGAWSHY